jgi:hypothetical protein
VIEHIPEPEKFFFHAVDILKHGGYLLVTCPNYRGKRPRMEKIGRLAKHIDNVSEYLHTAYKPKELSTMSEKAGLETIQVGTFEKELRYWRGPVKSIFRVFNPILGEERTFYICNRVINALYSILLKTGVLSFIRRSVREGSRSFIVARKPQLPI